MARNIVKQIVTCISLVIVLPLVVAERILRKVARRDVWFHAHTELLALIPGKVGSYLRNAYYNGTLSRCPRDCCFSFGSLVTHSAATIGHRVYIGAYCLIGLADIGDDTMLADAVQVLSGSRQHGTDSASRFQDQAQTFRRVFVGKNCWIGARAVVMHDICDGCIIGAGAVVTRPLLEKCTAVGIPARPRVTSIDDGVGSS